MKLSKLIKALLTITVVSLIYINMQMQILDLAYQGKNKEKIIRQLNEKNGNVEYNILKLKSSNYLGLKLLENNSDMQFLGIGNVVQLIAPRQELENKVVLISQPVKKLNPLLSFFSLKSQAEARPQE